MALVAMLTGVVKASRRATQEFVEDVLGIPISLGAVSHLESEVSGSLAEAHAEAGKTVRDAPRTNVDETGWKQAGKKCWLWTAATPLVAFFVIHPRRGKEGFFALIDKMSVLTRSVVRFPPGVHLRLSVRDAAGRRFAQPLPEVDVRRTDGGPSRTNVHTEKSQRLWG